MTNEEKQLLLKDICGRLPYHVRVKVWLKDKTTEEGFFDFEHNYGDILMDFFFYNKLKDLKPYLRPMSSMTEEEMKDYGEEYDSDFKFSMKVLADCWENGIDDKNIGIPLPHHIDWLNQHHFDYRGLIEKGLALEAPEKMYC